MNATTYGCTATAVTWSLIDVPLYGTPSSVTHISPAQLSGSALRKGNPTADLLERKLKHFFGLMDRDGSKTLELGDYLTTADQDSAENAALRGRFTRFSEDVVLPMDANGDGSVSFEEYYTAYGQGVRDSEEGYDRIKPIANAIISVADSGDGCVTREAYTLGLSHGFGVPAEHCDSTFTLLDTENKGFLTREQLQGAAADYFLSTELEAPGNNLSGGSKTAAAVPSAPDWNTRRK